jgi:hypothetical protein
LQKFGNPLQVATIIASMPWVYIKDVALGGWKSLWIPKMMFKSSPKAKGGLLDRWPC